MTKVVITLLVFLTLVGLIWANYQYALRNPGGNDFIPRWIGTRHYLLSGQSPYHPDTTLAIQQMVFGRPAYPDEDQSLFVYPFYAIFLFAPYAIFPDFALARALWMVTLEISLMGMAAIALSLADWKPKSILLVMLLIFIILWYHSVRPLINGNPALLVALFVTAAMLAIRSGRDILAGFLLALATIKPHMVILLVALVLIWGISLRRWRLVGGLLGGLSFLVVISCLFQPDWLLRDLEQMLAYPTYTLPGSPGAIFEAWWPGIGHELGWLLSIVLAGVLLVAWQSTLGKEFRYFFWTACLTLVITNLIGIRTATANYVALLPALILVLSEWDRRWGRLGRWLVVISLVGLFFGLWWLFIATIQRGDQPIQHPVMFFPLPVFLLATLLWVRRRDSVANPGDHLP